MRFYYLFSILFLMIANPLFAKKKTNPPMFPIVYHGSGIEPGLNTARGSIFYIRADLKKTANNHIDQIFKHSLSGSLLKIAENFSGFHTALENSAKSLQFKLKTISKSRLQTCFNNIPLMSGRSELKHIENSHELIEKKLQILISELINGSETSITQGSYGPQLNFYIEAKLLLLDLVDDYDTNVYLKIKELEKRNRLRMFAMSKLKTTGTSKCFSNGHPLL